MTDIKTAWEMYNHVIHIGRDITDKATAYRTLMPKDESVADAREKCVALLEEYSKLVADVEKF